MPSPRDRSRSSGSHVGQITNLSTGESASVTISPLFRDRCVDIVGNYGGDNPLDITREYWTSVGTVSGQSLSFPVFSYDNYPFDNSGIVASHLPNIEPMPSPGDAALRLIERTNPSRTEVSLPNFLIELRDIPEMLHLKGRNHQSSKPKNSAVEWNFGWSLLIQDIRRLVNTTSLINARVKEIKGLYKNGGLHRKRKLFSESLSATTPTSFQTIEAGVSGYVYQTTRYDVWASTRWIPDVPSIPTEDELVNEARKAVLGLDTSPVALLSVLWEAVPWSWMADYFGAVGSYLAASRNTVGAHASPCCVMQHTTSNWRQVVTALNPGFDVAEGGYVLETKSRVLATADFSVSMPFLSSRQVANLASIAFNLGR